MSTATFQDATSAAIVSFWLKTYLSSLGNNIGTEFHDNASSGRSANGDIEVALGVRPAYSEMEENRTRNGREKSGSCRMTLSWKLRRTSTEAKTTLLIGSGPGISNASSKLQSFKPDEAFGFVNVLIRVSRVSTVYSHDKKVVGFWVVIVVKRSQIFFVVP